MKSDKSNKENADHIPIMNIPKVQKSISGGGEESSCSSSQSSSMVYIVLALAGRCDARCFGYEVLEYSPYRLNEYCADADVEGRCKIYNMAILQ